MEMRDAAVKAARKQVEWNPTQHTELCQRATFATAQRVRLQNSGKHRGAQSQVPLVDCPCP